ncbi:class I SAM-dependent methyltransferase [Cyanobacteria bacterium FACHB-63]|nr:class I SAM-dependent methyltransferase [Cyanobacteria bacterium FACHB-63]
MRCPQCLQTLPELVGQCQCGFAFDEVAAVDLQDWFAKNQQILETAYTNAPTPWQQSGKSGTFEDWVRLRIANLAPVQRSGTYLDIGCANGYLLECLAGWARLKELEIIPHGLDYSAKLVALARQRLPTSSHLYVGNAWNWIPVQRFDYVRTELDYVPRNYRKPFVERLLAEFVEQNGRLIISQYRSRHDDLTQGWVERELERYGFRDVEVHSGYSADGLELCRVAVLHPADSLPRD